MRFEFDLNKQDYIDFNICHIKNSETLRKSLLFQQYIPAVVYLVLPFILVNVTDIPLWLWLTVFVLAAILWVVFYPKYLISSTIKRISKMVNEGKNKDMLGKHCLTFNDEGIIETSKNGESKISWSGIEEIKETDKHFFIYISSIMAYIVPKRVFKTDGEKDEFLNFIKNKL